MQKFRIFVTFLALQIPLLANPPVAPKNFIPPKQKENILDLQAREFSLNLTPKDIDSVQKKEQAVQEALDRFSSKEINYKPVIRPLASMDSISLHPYFTTTLLLPKGSVIMHVDTSAPMAVMKFENNAILLRPNANFQIANLTILYKLKDTNHVLNILASFYELNKEMDKLNLLYSYSNHNKKEPLEVLQAYIKEHKTLPQQQYSYIQIDDITYRIVEDNEYGNLFVNGKQYRIDNNTIYR